MFAVRQEKNFYVYRYLNFMLQGFQTSISVRYFYVYNYEPIKLLSNYKPYEI